MPEKYEEIHRHNFLKSSGTKRSRNYTKKQKVKSISNGNVFIEMANVHLHDMPEKYGEIYKRVCITLLQHYLLKKFGHKKDHLYKKQKVQFI